MELEDFIKIVKEAVREQCDGTYSEGFESVVLHETFGKDVETLAEKIGQKIFFDIKKKIDKSQELNGRKTS